MSLTHHIYRKFFHRPRYHVVIIGANFAGLKAALKLDPDDFTVTVIDPGGYFEFLPNIHELISNMKEPEHLRFSRENLIRKAGHRFYRDTVVSIDPMTDKIVTKNGNIFIYDYCIIAIGGQNRMSKIKGAERYCLPFTSVAQSVAIGNRLSSLIKSKPMTHIVIIGGGPEGIEILGEILRAYKSSPGLRIHLIEQEDYILPHYPRVIDREIRSIVGDYPVFFHTHSTVKRVKKNSIQLSTGETLKSDLCICTGGLMAPSLLYESGFTDSPNSFACVKDTLQSQQNENVFIVGDAADFKGIGKQAYHAIEMGILSSNNIEKVRSGKKLNHYEPSMEVKMIAFGDLDTFLISGNTVFAGTILYSLKESIYHYNMACYDPPSRIQPTLDMFNRIENGLKTYVLPTITSLQSIKKLANIRVLDDRL